MFKWMNSILLFISNKINRVFRITLVPFSMCNRREAPRDGFCIGCIGFPRDSFCIGFNSGRGNDCSSNKLLSYVQTNDRSFIWAIFNLYILNFWPKKRKLVYSTTHGVLVYHHLSCERLDFFFKSSVWPFGKNVAVKYQRGIRTQSHAR